MNHSLYRQRFFKRPGFLSAIHGFFSRTGKASTGIVTAGQGQVIREGNILKIEQSSREMIVAWQDFNLGPDESVHIHQPDTTAIALIRVTGSKASKLMGQVWANGQVFLVNENGVLIGEAAEITAAGMVVTTLGLSEQDFLAGRRVFRSENQAEVTNLGVLRARDGGYVALLGQQVNNQGTATANLGAIALAAASQVALKLAGTALLDATVEKAAQDALAENRGHVQADGGHVLMGASAVDTPLNTVVRNEGVIRAQTVDNLGGVIRLQGGEEGVTVVNGILDASAPEKGNGGRVETCGAYVKVMDTARITTLATRGNTGQWEVDPPEFTVALSDGDITGAALSAQLSTTNVTLQSSQGTVKPNGKGNININDEVSWSANTTLTLEAVNDINISNNVTATGDTAGLILSPGSGRYSLGQGAKITLSGATPGLTITATNYTIIQDVNDLQNATVSPVGNYALGQDVDASITSSWNDGAGFAPGVGWFTGVLDGLGHVIVNLSINRPTIDTVGLFSRNTGNIRNLGLLDCSITGGVNVGGLVAFNNGPINNCFVSGSLSGADNIGGIAGFNAAAIDTCYVTANVSGSDGIGGLVGNNTGPISNSNASGNISGAGITGGLVGVQRGGPINNCYATGTVHGGRGTGGLVGELGLTTINGCYATGNVVGSGGLSGGLVGLNNGGTISNSYATGSVSGSIEVGGLVGSNNGSINTSYAAGHVFGSGSSDGGLIGVNRGQVNYSYWDIQTTGQTRGGGGIGLTTGGCPEFCVNGFPVNRGACAPQTLC